MNKIIHNNIRSIGNVLAWGIAIMSLCFYSTPSYAQIKEDVFYEIRDFSDMLNSQVSPYVIPKGGAVEAQNLRSNEQFGSLAKREDMLLYGNCRSSAVKGLHRYYRSDDTKYLLVASSTFLDKGDDNGGACLELASGLSSGKRWDFITYKDIAIGLNGVDRPLKYDGHTKITANTDGSRTSGDIASELGAPFAELNTGSNLDASSWYQYKMAFYDGITYRFSDARSQPILTGSSVRNIRLTDIPLGEATITTRQLYRTEGNSSRANVLADTSYFFLDTISDNTTRTYNDIIVDGTISPDRAPTRSTVEAGVDVTPPKGKHVVIHNEKVFIANESVLTFGKSTIYWSVALNPDYFITGVDFELIRPDAGDEITCIKNLLGILVICKNNTILRFFTDSSDSTKWELSDPFTHIGTNSPYSVTMSPLGLMYLGEQGIYIFNGNSSRLISDKVTKDIRDISESSIAEVVGIYYKNEYQMAYTSKETGAGSNDKVLIFDVVRDSYTIDTKNVDSFEAFNAGDDFGILYSGSSTTSGEITAHSSSPSLLINRFKSELEAGTQDSIDFFGTEQSPSFEIGWGATIDSVDFAGVTLDSVVYVSAIIDRPGLTGAWFSKAAQINATNLIKLSWNETLGSAGDVTWAIKVGTTLGDIDTAAFSSEFTDPTGSDVSGVTANNFIQLRGTLTTTDINLTPNVFFSDGFFVKLNYSISGNSAETSVLTIWKSGFDTLGAEFANFDKRINEIYIYYEGTSGTLNYSINNDE